MDLSVRWFGTDRLCPAVPGKHFSLLCWLPCARPGPKLYTQDMPFDLNKIISCKVQARKRIGLTSHHSRRVVSTVGVVRRSCRH